LTAPLAPSVPWHCWLLRSTSPGRPGARLGPPIQGGQRRRGGPHPLSHHEETGCPCFFFSAVGGGLLALLAACGGGSPSPTAAPAASAPKAAEPAKPGAGGPATITFSAVGDAKMEQPVFGALKEAFMKAQEKVAVEVQPFPEGGYAKAVAMLEAKDTPDIIRIEDDQAWLVGKSGHVQELTSFFEKDFVKPEDYHSFFFQETHVEGKQFAFNPNHVPALIFYNEDHFKEAGLTAPTKFADAWDFDTFYNACKKLAKIKGDFVERYAASFDGFPEWMPYSAGVGIYTHEQTKCMLDDPKYVEVLKSRADLTAKEKLLVPPGENPIELFNSGQLAMFGHVAHQAQIINPSIKWKWMPYPKWKKYPYSSGYGRTFVIPKYGPTKNPEAAWEFFKFWATEEGSTIIAKQPWGVPPHRKGNDGFLKDPRWADKNVGLWLEALDFTYPREPIPTRFGAHRNIYENGPKTTDILLGKLDVAAWLKEVTAEMDADIKKNNWKHVPAPFADKPPHDKSVYARWHYLGADRADDPRKQ
jgi:ABC-type glycerol-3-phosphate transport system substrate-binding protein